MATIPTVPTFTEGEYDLANLDALSQCVTFLADMDYRPVWHYYKTATQSMTANTWTLGAYGSVAADTDGTWFTLETGAATTHTQGYYAVEGGCDFLTTATATQIYSAFVHTAGANNPHYTSGTQLYFGMHGTGFTTAVASTDTGWCGKDICPNVCYPGDSIGLYFYEVGTTYALNNNANANYLSGRFVANFSGYYVRTGS